MVFGSFMQGGTILSDKKDMQFLSYQVLLRRSLLRIEVSTHLEDTVDYEEDEEE